MRKINKDTPLEQFTEFVKKKKPSIWDDLPPNLRFDMRMHMLVFEQDCLCGYSEIPLTEESNSSHIDHFVKRDDDNKKTFDWDNMIVSTVDEDFGGKYKDNTYKIKKNDYSQIFNPVIDDMAQYIEYSGDGSIIPKQNLDKKNNDKVIKTIEVFNLNNKSLKKRRAKLLSDLRNTKGIEKDKLIKYFQSQGFVSLIEWFSNTY